jgi:hypothetical protein
MRTIHLIAFTAAAAFTASAAMADDAASPANAAQLQMASLTPDAGKLVCSYQIHEGMLLRQRVCRTLHQVESLRSTRQREIAEFQIHGGTAKAW